MDLIGLIKNIVSGYKRINTKILPSQGYFYPKDFEVKIKKATDEDVIDYEFNFDADNIMRIIESVKKIVYKNTFFSKDYKFEDLKSIDIVFLFLEIVKYTKNKVIKVDFFNDSIGKRDSIDFDINNFEYFDLKKFDEFYDQTDYLFLIDGYKFSMPSVGVENSLTQYLIDLADIPGSYKYSDYSYDFLFFLGWKNNLTFDEIENLITIFNSDIDDSEKNKIKSIIKKFIKIIDYHLKTNNSIIDLKSNIDFHNIWKS